MSITSKKSRGALRKRPASHRDSSSTGRRKKRQTKTNGDRQYFAAVRKLRRDGLDKWLLEHKPDKFKARLVQLTLQAKKRQWKQERRDLLKTMPVGTRVKPRATRAIGEVIAVTRDPEFPVTVQFKSGLIEDFDPTKLEVKE